MPSRRVVLSVALLFVFAGALNAQNRQSWPIASFGVVPYDFLPVGVGQHNIALATATPLTTPQGAVFATVCATTAAVRYTTDGVTTPTPTLGQPLAAGSCVALSGAKVLSNFRAASAGGVLDVEYFQ